MDPTENLREQLEVARYIRHVSDNPEDGDNLSEEQEIDLTIKADRLAELVLALDEWIGKGGFLPARWTNA